MSAWNIAFRSLGRRRLRTGLTVSGIVVGVALMLIMLSLASGMEVQTRHMIRALGGADITVYNATTPGRREFFPEGLFGVARTLNESLVQSIAQIPGVYAVSPQLSFRGHVNGTSITIHGIDPTTYSSVTGGLNIVSGRSLLEDDEYKIVLGKAFADSLNATIGDNVIVGIKPRDGLTFTIVGIFETGIIFQEYAGYIPLKKAQDMTDQQGLVTQIFVKCVDPDKISSVSDAISNLILGVRVISPMTMVQRMSEMLNALTMFFVTISSVAIIAGSFGVVNTMLMSVVERTREIGTLKAIGARDITILRIFLTEALLIGLIGGGVGVIAGAILSYVFPMLIHGIFGAMPFGREGAGFMGVPFMTPVITPFNIVLCLSLGILIGVLAGLYPAWRAARMRPVEALRHV